MGESTVRIAAIDIGSDTVHLLIADATRDADGIRVEKVEQEGELLLPGHVVARDGRIGGHVAELEAVSLDGTREFRRCVVFAGQLVFEKENLFTRSLHHETAFSIQRRLQFRGVQVVIMPIRVWAHVRAA